MTGIFINPPLKNRKVFNILTAHMQVLGPQHVPQSGGGQEPGGLAGILDVDHGVHGVENLEINNSIYSHGHLQTIAE